MIPQGPEILFRYFPEFTESQRSQFIKLAELYKDVNSRLNLISRSDIENIYERHILHSLAVAKFIKFKEGSSILDLGTGGGLPGIPLAITFPDVQFKLVDSILKKTEAVKFIVQNLGLENVMVECIRAEKLTDKFDFVVSRATAPMEQLVKWSSGILERYKHKNSQPNGIIALKGGDLRDELAKYSKRVNVIPITDYFDEEFFKTKKIVYLSS